MKPIRKFIDFEIKNINEEERAFDAIASTEAIDRDGDIILAAGWKLKNFKKNPVILWAHNYSDFPIAKALWIKTEDNKLIFRPQFATKEQNPVAEQAYQLYKGGFLKTFSVGFMGKKWEQRVDENYPYGREYKEQELLEISGCPVPSNPEALGQASVKSLLEKTIEGIIANQNPIKEANIEDDIDIKSGRVLSAKNRTLIKSCVTKMTESINALTELIEATEIEEDSQGNELIKLLRELKEGLSKS